MNKDIGAILNEKLGVLPFVERQAGVVQTIEYATVSQDEKTVFERFPASAVLTAEECKIQMNLQDLVPNSSKRGILYFEDFGTQPTASRVRNNRAFTSRLRLVCWLNKKLLVADPLQPVTTQCINYMVGKLVGLAPFNAEPFTRISVQVLNILPADKNIFARYTYREAVNQHLMPPFEFFAIDLQVSFNMPNTCIEDLLILEPKPKCTL